MLSSTQLFSDLQDGKWDGRLCEIYSCSSTEATFYRSRFEKCLSLFEKTFGKSAQVSLFSAPGRTEIGGNHTDHQHGHVLAGSVSLDIIAAAAPTDTGLIRIQSEGYPLDVIELSNLELHEEETGQAASLIRGIAARLRQLGYSIGGLDAYTLSSVPKGSGLSSSAAFEVLVGNILNSLYCGKEVDPVEIARIGQYAENTYFGKPSGLMDQMACSVGGIIGIDFGDTAHPVMEKVPFDFSHAGHALCILESGADHSDLTGEYASIPQEMKRVAQYFGEDYLRRVPEDAFLARLSSIREAAGDRACLRAMHYYADDRRAVLEKEALKREDFTEFTRLVTESGHSSFMYLQNVSVPSRPQEQSVAVALALCDRLLEGRGAYRVHGGGFAGTVQAFVPLDLLEQFQTGCERVLGEGSCHVLTIRSLGGVQL